MLLGGLIACGVGVLLLLAGLVRFPRVIVSHLIAIALMAGGAFLAYSNRAEAPWLETLFAKGETKPASTLMEDREAVMALENKVASETARLQTAYTALNATFSKLDKNDAAAVATYNAQAKIYQEQKASLDALKSELARRQVALQQQIDQAPARSTASTPPAAGSTPRKVAAGPPGEIVLYLKKGNPAVTMARAYLSGRRLTYREVDVDASEENRKEWGKYGTAIPTIVVGGQAVNGFVRDELDRLIPVQEDSIDSF